MSSWTKIANSKVFYGKRRKPKSVKAIIEKHVSEIQSVPGNKIKRFYESYEWRKLRYSILKKYGFKCLACGRSSADGAVLHVDHIKPVRANWHLRLDQDNLQPLCDWCNHGKGNWDETDLRPTNK